MTFRPEMVGACEAAKIAPLMVQYLQGRCLDVGSGPGKVWPPLTGIDIATNGGRPVTDMVGDGRDLSMFADEAFDGVFSSFLLQMFEPSETAEVLAEWASKIKVGGHLVLYVPDADQVPDEHLAGYKRAFRRGEIEALLRDQSAWGWELRESEVRSNADEYGLLVVARKAERGWSEAVWERNPGGRKRALVIRLGAFGDAFVAASTFPGLKEQGYHLTVNGNLNTYEVLKHDPHVDEWFIQDKDFVPNEMLGPYWTGLGQRYDRIVNLSESVEGLLLTLPGRLNHSYSYEARRAIYDDVNYLEHTHNVAAVPHEFSNARFHATDDERRWARAVRDRMNGPVIAWCVNGSSMHKVYPFVQVVGKWLLDKTPAHLVLYGDPGVGLQLQRAIIECLQRDGCDVSRVLGVADKWKIRQSLAFAQVVDCIVGPETGPMNAVAVEVVRKVLYLSHSTAANLTKHWRNTTVLIPDVACHPCHQLHSTWEFCHRSAETGAAVCASSITPSAVFDAIMGAIGARKAA